MTKKNSLEKIDCIIFDFDGVLVDSNHIKAEAFQNFYNKNPKYHEISQFLTEKSGLSRFEKFSFIENEILGNNYSIKESTLLSKFSEMVMNKVINAKWIDGAIDFLDTAKNKVPMYVVSAAPQEELLIIIKKRELVNYFNFVYGSPKSKVDNIKTIIKQNKYDNNKVLMVGDAIEDYQSSIASNIFFIGKVSNEKNVFPENVITIQNLHELERKIFGLNFSLV